MTDIFISYAKEDRSQARRLADAFEELGWSVWWDREIPAGEDFTDFIKQQLDGARCVVVLWSTVSVASRWVKREASRADEQKKLIPVLIEDVTPPWVFEELQARDLTLWRGNTDGGNFPQLTSDMARILGEAPNQGAKSNGDGESVPSQRKDDTPQSSEPDQTHKEPERRLSGRHSTWYAVLILAIAVSVFLLAWGRWFESSQPDTVVAVKANLDADKTSIVQGESTILKWETTGAREVRLEPGIGDVSTSGSTSVSPREDTEYRLMAKGPGGIAEDNAKVLVVSAPSTVVEAATIDRSRIVVNVLGIPNSESAIAAMRAAGYRANLYGQTGRPLEGFQVISIGTDVPFQAAQELLTIARQQLPSLNYVVMTEDRPDIVSMGGNSRDREVSFAVTNRVLSDFREATPLPTAGWQRLFAATDNRTFQRVVRAYYRVD